MEEKRQSRWKRQIKWIKEGAKNFRLSLSLRVSLNYLRFFLINGVLFFGIMGLLYLWEEMKPSKEIVEQMVVLLEMDEEKFIEFAIVEQPEKLSVLWQDEKGAVTLYSDGDEDWQRYFYLFDRYHFSHQDGEWKLLIQDKQELFRNGMEYQVYFYYDLSEELVKAASFFIKGVNGVSDTGTVYHLAEPQG